MVFFHIVDRLFLLPASRKIINHLRCFNIFGGVGRAGKDRELERRRQINSNIHIIKTNVGIGIGFYWMHTKLTVIHPILHIVFQFYMKCILII